MFVFMFLHSCLHECLLYMNVDLHIDFSLDSHIQAFFLNAGATGTALIVVETCRLTATFLADLPWISCSQG